VSDHDLHRAWGGVKIYDRRKSLAHSHPRMIERIMKSGDKTFIFYQGDRFRAYDVQRTNPTSERTTTRSAGYYDSWHETPESVISKDVDEKERHDGQAKRPRSEVDQPAG
jgi:hypothetical protein